MRALFAYAEEAKKAAGAQAQPAHPIAAVAKSEDKGADRKVAAENARAAAARRLKMKELRAKS